MVYLNRVQGAVHPYLRLWGNQFMKGADGLNCADIVSLLSNIFNADLSGQYFYISGAPPEGNCFDATSLFPLLLRPDSYWHLGAACGISNDKYAVLDAQKGNHCDPVSEFYFYEYLKDLKMTGVEKAIRESAQKEAWLKNAVSGIENMGIEVKERQFIHIHFPQSKLLHSYLAQNGFSVDYLSSDTLGIANYPGHSIEVYYLLIDLFTRFK